VAVVFEYVWLGEVGQEKHHSASVSLLFVSWLGGQQNIISNKTQQQVREKKERVVFTSGL